MYVFICNLSIYIVHYHVVEFLHTVYSVLEDNEMISTISTPSENDTRNRSNLTWTNNATYKTTIKRNFFRVRRGEVAARGPAGGDVFGRFSLEIVNQGAGEKSMMVS